MAYEYINNREDGENNAMMNKASEESETGINPEYARGVHDALNWLFGSVDTLLE